MVSFRLFYSWRVGLLAFTSCWRPTACFQTLGLRNGKCRCGLAGAVILGSAAFFWATSPFPVRAAG